jgi:hypothetical protein
MVPHRLRGDNQFFVVEKPGLDVADMGGYVDDPEDNIQEAEDTEGDGLGDTE